METFERLREMNSSPSTSYAEDSRVSRTALQASAEPQMTSATSGLKCSESFARLSPDGSWVRMCQGYCQAKLDGSLGEFSETWPKAGIVSDGIAYRRVPLMRRIAESGSLSSQSWRTPDAHCARGSYTSENMQRRIDRGMPLKLNDQIMHPEMWPTPRAFCHKDASYDRGRHNLGEVVHNWPTPRAGKITDEEPESWQARQAQGQVATPPLTLAVKLWPTPTAQDGKNATLPPSQATRDTLPGAMIREKQWRTPTTGMVKEARGHDPERMQKALAKGQSVSLAAQTHAEEAETVQQGGQLNPDWVECLMGFPQGWTRLDTDTTGPAAPDNPSADGSRQE
jgi:hypothetical protein